ncbi:AAA family ATPase [Nannocystis pusilla]|uniref:AAA family ATPase n=1 Tax=Nannocystis pusilla TaxID=889268 RepID=A0A9X3F1Q2_9BACT|nr:AAA family ATPase [Nannocystis pusilla]
MTVTGLGGMGKTRLAQRFAEAQAASYTAPGAGGVWFCDLTGVHGATAACSAVASALGLQLGADEPALAEHLAHARAARTDLVVLDNFEQLADVAEATLGRWLRASRARFLVTSRIALGLAGEHLWPLHPLQLPPPGLRDEAALAAIESIDLFVRRARQLRPDLVLRPDDLAAIAEIVRRLDGIPLAIELAAARITVLSVVHTRPPRPTIGPAGAPRRGWTARVDAAGDRRYVGSAPRRRAGLPRRVHGLRRRLHPRGRGGGARRRGGPGAPAARVAVPALAGARDASPRPRRRAALLAVRDDPRVRGRAPDGRPRAGGPARRASRGRLRRPRSRARGAGGGRRRAGGGATRSRPRQPDRGPRPRAPRRRNRRRRAGAWPSRAGPIVR